MPTISFSWFIRVQNIKCGLNRFFFLVCFFRSILFLIFFYFIFFIIFMLSLLTEYVCMCASVENILGMHFISFRFYFCGYFLFFIFCFHFFFFYSVFYFYNHFHFRCICLFFLCFCCRFFCLLLIHLFINFCWFFRLFFHTVFCFSKKHKQFFASGKCVLQFCFSYFLYFYSFCFYFLFNTKFCSAQFC